MSEKNIKCTNVKTYCLLVKKRYLHYTDLKKDICKTLYRLNMQKISTEISAINASVTTHEMHVACRILVHHRAFHFFSTTLPP